jgi:cystathionine beta-lyase/cystathionine gamma-synthase
MKTPANQLSSENALGQMTRAVHSGERSGRPDYTPTVSPIHPATSFFYEDTATLDAVFGHEREGYVYTRYGNPTISAFEAAVADMEGTEAAVAYASGMAAVYGAILHEVSAGAKIVFTRLFADLGVETVFVDALDIDAVAQTVAEVKPRAIYCETVSNPLMRVADISELAAIARKNRARLIVDNTFPSPCLVNPYRHGADVVIHSATKYLAGHGDVTGGVIATDAMRAAELREDLKLTGAILGPFEAWLALRGMKTLPLRIERQSMNAAEIAAWLVDHPAIAHVNYPGLDDLGGAEALFNDDRRGGMISFDIAGADKDAVFRFLESLKLIMPATTLGDVYSLTLYPAISSHRALTPEQRAEIGIGDGLVRLSVGIEDVEDIIADLDQALNAAAGAGAVAEAGLVASHD